jgi:protein TonB
MNDHVMPDSSPLVFSTNYSLWVAIVIAVFVHIVITLEIELPKPEPETLSRDIDVTLISAPSTEAPEKAQFLAQENQLASGQQTSKPEPVKQLETPLEKMNPAPPVKPAKVPEKIKPLPPVKPSPKVSEKIKLPPPVKPIAKEPEKIKPLPDVKPIDDSLPPVSKSEIAQKILTQQKAEQKIVIPSNPNTSSRPEIHQHLSAAMLQQQIIEEASETTQRRPVSVMQETTIKSVKQVSAAHKNDVAAYVIGFDDKVERIGERNYPAVAMKPDFSATLTLEVSIKLDGSIHSMRITQSSGNPELDEAAKKIVRLSAPFPPLSVALRGELDVLVITRSWKFSDQSGLITQ